MKKLLPTLSAALLLAAPFSSYAKSVTPEEALQRVERESPAHIKKKSSAVKTVLCGTIGMPSSDDAALYLFSKGNDNGYIVAPADDLFPAVLGYSDSGSFSADNMPDAMKWWLGEYASQMEAKLNTPAKNNASVRAGVSSEKTPVGPLLKTQWNQGAPDNNKIPNIPGYDKFATGCVATAFAQILKYHNWPEKGEGSHSYSNNYKVGTSSYNLTFSYDFANAAFDWNNMLNQYDDKEYTVTQANAVAELMYACGVSVDMDYNMESGADTGKVLQALVNNFKYSKDVRFYNRDYMTSVEWENIIYDNLSRKLPVLYAGTGSAGGHAFVCDGYSERHYFHINWGWAGASDGYFLLSALDPESLGIGGGAGGFNSNQRIVTNIQPRKEGETSELESYILCRNDFDSMKSRNGNVISFGYSKVNDSDGNTIYPFLNWSYVDFNGEQGVFIVDDSGNEKFYTGGSRTLGSGYATSLWYADIDGLSPGRYKVYPAFRLPGKEARYMKVINGSKQYLNIEVKSDGTISVLPYDLVEKLPKLAVTTFNYAGDILNGANTDVTMNVLNLSDEIDYKGDIKMHLYQNDVKKANVGFEHSVDADCCAPLSFSLRFGVPAGDYTVRFEDKQGNPVAGEFPITVKDGSGKTIEDGIQCIGISPTQFVPGKDVSITFLFQNTGTSAANIGNKTFDILKEDGTFSKSFTANLNYTLNSGYGINSSIIFGNKIGWSEGRYFINVVDKDNNRNITKYYNSMPFMVTVGYPVESVALDRNSHAMNVGDSHQLGATVLPANASFATLNWLSSDPSVASVDKDGNVKAVSEGNARIIASAPNGRYDICELTVDRKTGIDEILSGEVKVKKVLSANGMLLLSNPAADRLRELPKGIYIVVTDKKNVKFVK